MIEGLRDYYAAPHQCIVRLRIAGDAVETLIAEYRRMIDAYSLAEYAEVIGPRSGAGATATASPVSRRSKTANTPHAASRSYTRNGTATSTAWTT